MFLTQQQARQLVEQYGQRQQYDSVLSTATNFISQELGRQQVDTAISIINEVYDSLRNARGLQEDFALFLYNNRKLLEKDTLALKKVYRLWTFKYAYEHFAYRYNARYISIAEYCITLPGKFPNLHTKFLYGFNQNLGIIYNITGDLKKTINYYNANLEYGRQYNDNEAIASAIQNMGIALVESNLPDSVINLSHIALGLQDIAPRYRCAALINLAAAWTVKHDMAGALQYLQQAKALALDTGKIKAPGDLLIDIYRILAGIELRTGRYTKGIEAARQACMLGIQNYHYRHRVVGKTLQQVADNFLGLQQTDSALWYYHQALYTVAQTDSANINSLPAVKDLYAENTLMDALDGMANAWDAKFAATSNRDFLQQALQCRQLAFGTEKKLLETFTYDEAMSGLLRESKNRSKKALLNCYNLWQAGGEAQWVEQAIQVAEKSKAIVLLHSVRRNRAAANNDADSLLNQLQQLRYQEIVLQTALSQGTITNKDSLLQRQQDIGQQYLALESTLKEQHPELKRSGTDAAQLTLDNLFTRLLAPGTCLLEFFEADSVTCVIWVGANGKKGIYLPGREVQAYTGRYAASLQTPDAFLQDSTAFYQTALRCSQLLLPPPIITGLQNGLYNHIIAIPDGRVSLLPFEAMVLPGPNGHNRFLIEYGTVNNGYSISTLLANLQDGPQVYSGALAVFTPFSKTGNQGLPRLAFTNNEAAAVQKQFTNSTRYDDAQAGIESFRHAVKETGIIHIASHAKAMDSQPPRIFLYNSTITMPELYAASTKAGLVVLSACQTGAGSIDINEGPLSLSRAFYYAGARNVINSLWQVQDDATAHIFEYFYEKFPAQPVTIALREAKLHYLHGQDASHRAPYYWAGLVHTGYEANKKQTGNNKLWWAALIATPAAIAGLLYYKRRRKR